MYVTSVRFVDLAQITIRIHTTITGHSILLKVCRLLLIPVKCILSLLGDWYVHTGISDIIRISCLAKFSLDECVEAKTSYITCPLLEYGLSGWAL